MSSVNFFLHSSNTHIEVKKQSKFLIVNKIREVLLNMFSPFFEGNESSDKKYIRVKGTTRQKFPWNDLFRTLLEQIMNLLHDPQKKI